MENSFDNNKHSKEVDPHPSSPTSNNIYYYIKLIKKFRVCLPECKSMSI